MLASEILKRIVAESTTTLVKANGLAAAPTIATFNQGGAILPGDMALGVITGTTAAFGTVLASWGSDELVAAGQDLNVAVTGSADADYEFESYLICNGGPQDFTMRLSSSGTNFESTAQGIAGDVGSGGWTTFQEGSADSMIASGMPSGSTMTLTRGRILQRTASAVVLTFDSYEIYAGASRVRLMRTIRRTTTGAITGVGVHSSGATGLDTGSWLRVKRISS